MSAPLHSPNEYADAAVGETPLLRCDLFPSLCNLPVESRLASDDFETAFDIVFVSEGYSDEELDEYRVKVEKLINGLFEESASFVHANPTLFNFHRVDLASNPGIITNADDSDTPVGGCFHHDELRDDWRLDVDEARARLAASSAPDVDAVVVIMNTIHGFANAGGRIVMNRKDHEYVLMHELGHELFNLGDEYGEGRGYALPPSTSGYSRLDVFWTRPNLTTDPNGAKWQHLVSGAEEGGARYDEGVYHPTDSCIMLDASDDAFCAVCQSHIDDVIHARRHSTRNSGPPLCALGFYEDPENTSAGASIFVRTWDANGFVYFAKLDGEEILHGGCHAQSCNPYSSRGIALPSDLALGEHELALECCDDLGLCAYETRTITVGQLTRGMSGVDVEP